MQRQLDNAVHWFEIPVVNLDRAQAFYEKLFDRPMRRESMGPETTLALFRYDDGAAGGCLMAGTNVAQPSQQGVMVYLNAEPSLDVVLARVETAGGRITTPKVVLPGDMGCFAHVLDTEGNRVGLHALA